MQWIPAFNYKPVVMDLFSINGFDVDDDNYYISIYRFQPGGDHDDCNLGSPDAQVGPWTLEGILDRLGYDIAVLGQVVVDMGGDDHVFLYSENIGIRYDITYGYAL